MLHFNRLFSCLLMAAALPCFGTAALADEPPVDYRSYQQKTEDKALSGITNITTGVLEIPKSIINTTNESNIIYGVVGGLFKGMIHTAGRIGVGVADLVTAPLPTKPIAYPEQIWDDFDKETIYGPTFRLDKSRPPVQPVAVLPPPRPVAPLVAPVQRYDRAQLYNSATNKRLDRVFKQEMMK